MIDEIIGSIQTTIAELDALDIHTFQKRSGNLLEKLDSFSENKISAGLVGITSSGKSSVLNVLLGRGEKVLKEQSKATTNMIVFCSKSKTPELHVYFENGEILEKKGDAIDIDTVWRYSSEDENKNNQFNVKYMKISDPGFLLPEGVEIADTPGLDAYGMKEHEDLTLREFLPHADLILYLIPVRSSIKKTDRDILNTIMEKDQRIIFVQTCVGAVQDKPDRAGGVVGRDEILEKYRRDLEGTLKAYPNFKDAPVVQLETSYAFQYFREKDENLWEASGFKDFVDIVEQITDALGNEFTLKKLRRTADEIKTLQDLIRSTLRLQDEKKDGILDEFDERIEHLKTLDKEIQRDIRGVYSKWKKQLDAGKLLEQFKAELAAIEDEKVFIRTSDSLNDRIRKIKAAFLDGIDGTGRKIRGQFEDIGLEFQRRDLQDNISKSSFSFTNIKKKIRMNPEHKGRSRKGITGSAGDKGNDAPGGRVSKYTYYLDKNEFYDQLHATLETFIGPLLRHLDWWDKAVAHSFLEPLERKISAIRNDMANISDETGFSKEQRSELTRIIGSFERTMKNIHDVINVRGTAAPTLNIPGKKRVKLGISKTAAPNLFTRLYHRIKENMFHACYLNTIRCITDSQNPHILLISKDPKEQDDFLRLLLRLDAASGARIEKEHRPFTFGYAGDLKGDAWVGENQLQDQFTFHLMLNDAASVKIAESQDLFRRCDVIQVVIEDLHRVSSALVDLIDRNLFFQWLSRHQNKLLFTYSKAAHFNGDKLHMLVTEAVEEVNGIFDMHPVNWFIHEDYEVRYNYFNQIASTAIKEKTDADTCVAHWISHRLPIDELFSETILRREWEMATDGR